MKFPASSSVYELSSRGALVRYLRRRFHAVYLSEYFDQVQPGDSRGGVPCQDVQALLLDDALFDLVTSTEVFEHVPDDRRGFLEIYRVLKDGGRFIFTVPLLDQGETMERAHMLADGAIEHLTDPEYHSDRIRGGRKVLAFRTYGRDICGRLDAAGFRSVIRTVVEPCHGIFGQPVIIAAKGMEP
jgi:SAM-dependent methyltransferase